MTGQQAMQPRWGNDVFLGCGFFIGENCWRQLLVMRETHRSGVEQAT
jgi:hypothetical protein